MADQHPKQISAHRRRVRYAINNLHRANYPASFQLLNGWQLDGRAAARPKRVLSILVFVARHAFAGMYQHAPKHADAERITPLRTAINLHAVRRHPPTFRALQLDPFWHHRWIAHLTRAVDS
jgi:hypothetical protein